MNMTEGEGRIFLVYFVSHAKAKEQVLDHFGTNENN